MKLKPGKSGYAMRRERPAKPHGEKWVLRLYVAGQTPETDTAVTNLKLICEEQLNGNYHLKVIDLTVHPHLARVDQILAIPTLVRKSPAPMRKIIGDLSDTTRVLAGLNLTDQGAVTDKAGCGY